MKRLKGPELKMPELKAPDFLVNLFYDLRDRRLLPLVGLVVVAIAAVPFLLGNSEETLELPSGGGVAAALNAAKARSSSLTVVEAKPGLRDYRKRLRAQQPTDPFKQRYTSPVLKGATLNEKGEGSKTGEGGETTSTSTTNGSSAQGGNAPAPSSGGAPSSPPAPGAGGKPHLTFFAFAINVRIVKSVGGVQGDPIVKERVLPQTPLPGEKTPVVTYMGPARAGHKTNGKVLLLVSNDVSTVEGDANCLSGDEICQLLEVEPGFPVILTYGEDEARYTINVLKFALVVTGHS
jgi:hypothetical protein